MDSVYDFVVTPLGNRYNNTKKVNDKTLITNTSIEDFRSVNNEAKVLGLPRAFKTKIEVGDIVVVHHNLFRRFYDIRGNQKNSRSFVNENTFLCAPDQIYLYKKPNGKWNTFEDRCFVQPLVNKSHLTNSNVKSNIGFMLHNNKSLEEMGVKNGDIVYFKNGREFKFVIDNKLTYCMKSNDIILKHGYKENEEEYNPSWASSS